MKHSRDSQLSKRSKQSKLSQGRNQRKPSMQDVMQAQHLRSGNELSYGIGSRANLFMCAAQLFSSGRYSVAVRVCNSKQGFQHLADFKMLKNQKVQQEIQQSQQKSIILHYEENPELCFLLRRRALSPEQEEVGECGLTAKDVLSFIGFENLKVRALPATALKFPIMKGQKMLGFIHVRFALELSKRERLLVLEEMQDEAQEIIAEIRRNQEQEKAIINELVEAFPKLVFDPTEAAVRVVDGQDEDIQFWRQVARDSEDKEASMQVQRDELKRQELGEKALKRTLLPEEVLRAKQLELGTRRNCGCQRECGSGCVIF